MTKDTTAETLAKDIAELFDDGFTTPTFGQIEKIEKLLTQTLTTTAQRVREETIEDVFQIEKEKWRDAEHCTCLGYALVQLAGGEDSEGGKKMEERLSTLNK